MAEWSIAAVLKTVDCHRSGGSNPSLSAKPVKRKFDGFFYVFLKTELIGPGGRIPLSPHSEKAPFLGLFY